MSHRQERLGRGDHGSVTGVHGTTGEEPAEAKKCSHYKCKCELGQLRQPVLGEACLCVPELQRGEKQKKEFIFITQDINSHALIILSSGYVNLAR